MDDLIASIHSAWSRVRPALFADQDELAKRLARRRRIGLRRPPRAWCLAVRASDLRIDGRSALITACAEDGGAECGSAGGLVVAGLRHGVTLDAELLRTVCAPVRIGSPGEPLDVVAKKLGVTVGCLLASRALGVVKSRHVKGLGGSRGWPVPMLFTDQLLDPGAKLFARADPMWAATAHWNIDRIADDLEQTIARVPCYRSHVPAEAYKEHRHPEVDAVARKRHAPRLVPRAGPDEMAWYKWKGDEYVGYDWRAAETNPRIRQRYERALRVAERRRERYHERRVRGEAPDRPSESGGSLHFNGWQWLCPVCGKTCRTIFYPLPRINLLENVPKAMRVPRLAEVVSVPPLVSGFACVRCHRVRFLSRAERDGWNHVVAYLTGGLLYGSEVERPGWFVSGRKRAYTPRPNANPSRRRPEVMELLLDGLTYAQIGERLKLSPRTINDYACKIYAQHGVHGRDELARKLGRRVERENGSSVRVCERTARMG